MTLPSDILICGGSLAGMATAIRLKQLGFDPLVVDKSHFPRTKLCGEFLGPDSFASLALLGVWDAVREQAYGPIRQVRFYAMSGKQAEIPLASLNADHPYGLALGRDTLDTILVEAGRKLGIAVWEDTRVTPSLIETEDGYLVRLAQKDEPEPTEHRFTVVVDATGRHGGLIVQNQTEHRPMMPFKRAHQHIGMQRRVRLLQGSFEPELSMFFFPGGYGGVQPLSSAVANLCCLAPVQAGRLLHEPFEQIIAHTIARNPRARKRLAHCEPIGDWHTTAQLNLNYPPHQKKRLISVGDAMATIDPFTGSGMALALQTGIWAAEAIAQGLSSNQSYRTITRNYWRQATSHLGIRFQLLKYFRPYLFTPWLQEMSWPMMQPLLPILARTFR